MPYSVENARQGLILLVEYLKKVHGDQVVHEINQILGSDYGLAMLYKGTRAIKLEHLYPLLEFASVEPYQFEKFISPDSYGYLPLYLFEIERLSPSQIRSLETQIRRARTRPAKRKIKVDITEVERNRFTMSSRKIADGCWATIESADSPEELCRAWALLSIVYRGQAKYSKAARCARRALELAKTAHRRGKVLQTICYLAQHLFDLKPAREIIWEARSAHFDAGDQTAMAQTWVDEAQVLLLDCEFEKAITAAREAEISLPAAEVLSHAFLQQTIGVAAINLDNVEEARRAHAQFRDLIQNSEPLNTPYCNTYCDYLRAEILVAEGRFSEASRHFQLLRANPSQTLHLMDQVLITLYLVLCSIAQGKVSHASSLAVQTRAYLKSLDPQTAATRRYSKLLSSVDKFMDYEMVYKIMTKVRRPPATLRRRPPSY